MGENDGEGTVIQEEGHDWENGSGGDEETPQDDSDDLMSGSDNGEPAGKEGEGQESDGGTEIEPWKMQISEEFRYHEALKGVKNPTEAVKKLIEANKKISESDGLAPKYRKDMSEEEFEAYKASAGVVTAEDLGEEFASEAEMFQKAGITKEQWEVLKAEEQKRSEEDQDKRAVEQQKARRRQKEKAAEELRSEWGEDYNDNIGYMSRAVNDLFDRDFVKDIRQIGLTNAPQFAKAMSKVGKMMADHMMVQSNVRGTDDGEGFDYDS